jgi:thiol-disulfide isomerase/thioredoxin
MKKFLPFLVFFIVFGVVLAGQIAYKLISNDKDMAKTSESTEYKQIESHFLEASYIDLKGQTIELKKLNAPIVIINFWASWCTPCLAEMPSMIKLKHKFKDNQVKVVAINTDEENQKDSIEKTIKKIGIKDEFIIIPDKEAKIVSQFMVSAIPVTYVFLKGRVVHLSTGPMDFNSLEFEEKMKEWLKN